MDQKSSTKPMPGNAFAQAKHQEETAARGGKNTNYGHEKTTAPTVKSPSEMAPQSRGRQKALIPPATPFELSREKGLHPVHKNRAVTDPHYSAYPKPLNLPGKAEGYHNLQPLTQTDLKAQAPSKTGKVVYRPGDILITATAASQGNDKSSSQANGSAMASIKDGRNQAVIMGDGMLAPTKDGSYGRTLNVNVFSNSSRINSMAGVIEGETLSPSVYSPESSPNEFVPKTNAKPSYRYVLENSANIRKNSGEENSNRKNQRVESKGSTKDMPSGGGRYTDTTSTETPGSINAHRTASTQSYSSNAEAPEFHPQKLRSKGFGGEQERVDHHRMESRQASDQSGFNVPMMFHGDLDQSSSPVSTQHTSYISEHQRFSGPPAQHFPPAPKSQVSSGLVLPGYNFVPPPPHYMDPPPNVLAEINQLSMSLHHHLENAMRQNAHSITAKHDNIIDHLIRKHEASMEQLVRSHSAMESGFQRMSENVGRIEGALVSGIAGLDVQVRLLQDEVRAIAKAQPEAPDTRLEKVEQGIEVLTNMMNTFNMRFSRLESTVETGFTRKEADEKRVQVKGHSPQKRTSLGGQGKQGHSQGARHSSNRVPSKTSHHGNSDRERETLGKPNDGQMALAGRNPYPRPSTSNSDRHQRPAPEGPSYVDGFPRFRAQEQYSPHPAEAYYPANQTLVYPYSFTKPAAQYSSKEPPSYQSNVDHKVPGMKRHKLQFVEEGPPLEAPDIRDHPAFRHVSGEEQGGKDDDKDSEKTAATSAAAIEAGVFSSHPLAASNWYSQASYAGQGSEVDRDTRRSADNAKKESPKKDGRESAGPKTGKSV